MTQQRAVRTARQQALRASGSRAWAGGQKEIHLHPSGLDFPPQDQVFMGIWKQLGRSSCGDPYPSPSSRLRPRSLFSGKKGTWGREGGVVGTHRRR